MILSVHAPNWEDLNQFLIAFWPNLVATGLGIAGGVPADFYLNRIAERRGERRSERDREARTRAVLTVTRASVVHDQEVASDLASIIDEGQVPTMWDLDSSVWEAVREQFVELRDPELQASIAKHFRRVEWPRRMSEMLFEQHFGLASALSGDAAMQRRTWLRGRVGDYAQIARADAADLLAQIDQRMPKAPTNETP
jgi:hypothetical protein